LKEEGADCLTLGHLAERAGISKPVVYDHFKTRTVLLIALYRWIDTEVVRIFQEAMAVETHSFEKTIEILSATYIRCASDKNGEFHAVGAALSGSTEKSAVFQELLDNGVKMFVSVLQPHTDLPTGELSLFCIGFVGSGEALASAFVRGKISEFHAITTLAVIMCKALLPESGLSYRRRAH